MICLKNIIFIIIITIINKIINKFQRKYYYSYWKHIIIYIINFYGIFSKNKKWARGVVILKIFNNSRY
jgi:hypothetical protein